MDPEHKSSKIRRGSQNSDPDLPFRRSFGRMPILDAGGQQWEFLRRLSFEFAMLSHAAPIMSEDRIGELAMLVLDSAIFAHSNIPSGI
jgi:hypothetical protein